MKKREDMKLASVIKRIEKKYKQKVGDGIALIIEDLEGEVIYEEDCESIIVDKYNINLDSKLIVIKGYRIEEDYYNDEFTDESEKVIKKSLTLLTNMTGGKTDD